MFCFNHLGLVSIYHIAKYPLRLYLYHVWALSSVSFFPYGLCTKAITVTDAIKKGGTSLRTYHRISRSIDEWQKTESSYFVVSDIASECTQHDNHQSKVQ